MERITPMKILWGLGRRLADLSLLLMVLKYLGLIDWPWSRVLLIFWATLICGATLGIMDDEDEDAD